MTLKDELTGALIGLARSTEGSDADMRTLKVICDGLKSLSSEDENELKTAISSVRAEKHRLVPDCAVCKNPCGRTFDFDMADLNYQNADIAKAKRGLPKLLAEYASRVADSERKLNTLCEGLFAIGYEWYSAEEINTLAEKLKDN